MTDPILRHHELIYESPRFTMRRERYDTVDGQVERPVIHHPGAVAVLARPTPDSVLLVRQWRYPLARWTWEIPAGTCQADEDPLATVQRELQEEAGFRAARFEHWFSFYPSMGLSDELLSVYQAFELSPASLPADHGELIEAAVLSLPELRALISRGELLDAKTLLAVSRLPGMADCYASSPC